MSEKYSIENYKRGIYVDKELKYGFLSEMMNDIFFSHKKTQGMLDGNFDGTCEIEGILIKRNTTFLHSFEYIGEDIRYHAIITIKLLGRRVPNTGSKIRIDENIDEHTVKFFNHIVRAMYYSSHLNDVNRWLRDEETELFLSSTSKYNTRITGKTYFREKVLMDV